MGVSGGPVNKAVGQELASALPQDNKAWYSRSHLLKLNFIVLSLIQFSSGNGYDGSVMNGLQALPGWNEFMGGPTGAWLGFVNAIYWIGVGVVSPLAAMLANKYGRKLGVWVGYGFLIAGAILQTAANNAAAFIIARFLLGCASGFFSNAVPLLINEIAYPTHRGIVSATFNCGWYIGSILAACITYGTRNYVSSWSWRLPSLLQIVLPLLAVPGLLMCPESPRWLTASGRNEQARRVLTTFHAGGDSDAPLVNFEMIEIETTIASEQAAKNSASYLDMVKTKGNRWRLAITVSLAIFSQWSGNGVVSYYLALVLTTVGITDVSDQLLINVGLQLWNLIFSVTAAFLVDKLGRRLLFLASAGTMLTSYIIVTGLSGSFAQTVNAATGTAVVPFLFFFFAGYDIALTPLLVAYPCEIWPYALRSRGLTVTWVTAVVAIAFNTFVNPIALEAIAWRYYIVFVVVLVVMCLTAYFYYPETRGHSLEQMAWIFDGEDVAAPAPAETKERVLSLSYEAGSIVDEKTGTRTSISHNEKV
ncbi:hypothetical protein LTS08_008493 [Lithohypha guttulata]|nr:hypothetical protein LTS08_008493 [Lithohypha guttulata]